MSDTLLRYTTVKLGKLESDKKNIYFELKDTESFLNTLMQIGNDFNHSKIPLLLQNKYAIKNVCRRYNIIDDDSLKTLFYLLNQAVTYDPAFTPKSHTVLSRILEKIYEAEDNVYLYYEKLDEEYKKIESDEYLYRKLILETAQGNIENELIIQNEFLELILEDHLINDGYRIKLLREINKHNNYVISSRILLDVSELEGLLNFYGFSISNEKSLSVIANKYSESVIKRILKKIKVLNLKFSNEILEKILLFGTSSETLQNAYNIIRNDERIQLISSLGIYNFWVNCPYTAKISENISSGVASVEEITEELEEDNPKQEGPSRFNQNNSELNSFEIFRTAEYLKQFPFYNAEFDKMKKILKIPVEKLEKRENLIGLYGVKVDDINHSMTLYSPHIITMLDQMIELDLHDYALKHLSVLSRPQSLPIVIYNNMKKGNNVANIKNGNKYLDASVVEQIGKYKDAVKDAEIVDINIPNRTQLDSILDTHGINNIVPDVFKMPIIKLLESNYKVNEYQYVIDEHIFSRIKVLRIVSGLYKEVKDFSYDEILYALTYSKIMNKADAMEVQNTIKNVYDEISKCKK